jgi:hypothetical protein
LHHIRHGLTVSAQRLDANLICVSVEMGLDTHMERLLFSPQMRWRRESRGRCRGVVHVSKGLRARSATSADQPPNRLTTAGYIQACTIQ